MLDHHLQRAIVYHLALAQSLRFSELKPDDVESKLFTYHLKKVLVAGFVQKDEDGRYSLTAAGRKLGIHALENGRALVDQAYSVLFMVVRRKSDHAWLLYRRTTHPLINRTGFMHGLPIASETTSATAAKTLLEKTGLSGTFTPLGGGYLRTFVGAGLESFTHFTLLVCEDADGELNPSDAHAEYYWSDEPNFSSAEMLPSMEELANRYAQGVVFYIERHYDVD